MILRNNALCYQPGHDGRLDLPTLQPLPVDTPEEGVGLNLFSSVQYCRVWSEQFHLFLCTVTAESLGWVPRQQLNSSGAILHWVVLCSPPGTDPSPPCSTVGGTAPAGTVTSPGKRPQNPTSVFAMARKRESSSCTAQYCIYSCSSVRLPTSPWKGGWPASISYTSTPSAHQSTAVPYG